MSASSQLFHRARQACFTGVKLWLTPNGMKTLTESRSSSDPLALEVTGSSRETVRLLEPHRQEDDPGLAGRHGHQPGPSTRRRHRRARRGAERGLFRPAPT
jgi:hypothetical protein